MTQIADRRKYQRCSNLPCTVYISLDGRRWEDVDLCDISATGARIKSETFYGNGAKLILNLCIYSMLTEFNMKFDASVKRAVRTRNRYSYAVKFENVSKTQQVQLDELICRCSEIMNKGHTQIKHEEGNNFSMPVEKKA